jgi:hypothetical protein
MRSHPGEQLVGPSLVTPVSAKTRSPRAASISEVHKQQAATSAAKSFKPRRSRPSVQRGPLASYQVQVLALTTSRRDLVYQNGHTGSVHHAQDVGKNGYIALQPSFVRTEWYSYSLFVLAAHAKGGGRLSETHCRSPAKSWTSTTWASRWSSPESACSSVALQKCVKIESCSHIHWPIDKVRKKDMADDPRSSLA